MNWTREQQRAIEEQGNLIVSAAAGAGKTAVLTERVVRLVEGGMDIDRLLILTFTRAAAAQMKERIQTALQQRAAASEGPTRARLYRQSARCPNASISTIHSFCRRVVDRYFHLVGLSPSAATLDETESAVLRDQATEEALTALATEDAPSYKRLIRAFEREEGVKGALNALTAFLMAQPDPAGWLDQAEEDLTSREAFDRGVLVCFDEDKATFHDFYAIYGWQIRKESGIGVGVEYKMDMSGGYSQLPVFIEVRSHYLRSQITPFTAAYVGYSFPLGMTGGTDKVTHILKGGPTWGLNVGARYAIPNTFGKLSKYGISVFVGYQGLFMDKVQLIEDGKIENALRVLMQNVKFGVGFNF